jgi:hypothetical protein
MVCRCVPLEGKPTLTRWTATSSRSPCLDEPLFVVPFTKVFRSYFPDENEQLWMLQCDATYLGHAGGKHET